MVVVVLDTPTVFTVTAGLFFAGEYDPFVAAILSVIATERRRREGRAVILTLPSQGGGQVPHGVLEKLFCLAALAGSCGFAVRSARP